MFTQIRENIMSIINLDSEPQSDFIVSAGLEFVGQIKGQISMICVCTLLKSFTEMKSVPLFTVKINAH